MISVLIIITIVDVVDTVFSDIDCWMNIIVMNMNLLVTIQMLLSLLKR